MCEGERECLAIIIVYLCKRERERGRDRERVTICEVRTLPIITDVYTVCIRSMIYKHERKNSM